MASEGRSANVIINKLYLSSRPENRATPDAGYRFSAVAPGRSGGGPATALYLTGHGILPADMRPVAPEEIDTRLRNELFEAGKVVPVIDGPYRLSEVPGAFLHFGEGRHLGKVVIAMDHDDST